MVLTNQLSHAVFETLGHYVFLGNKYQGMSFEMVRSRRPEYVKFLVRRKHILTNYELLAFVEYAEAFQFARSSGA